MTHVRGILSSGLGIALWLACASCDYRLLSPSVGDGQVIHVPTTVNDTRWRGIEASTTGSLRRELSSQLDLELGSSRAYDLLLKTRFVGVDRRAVVGNRQGGFTVGNTRVRLEWALESVSGDNLSQGTVVRDLEFLTGTEEDLTTSLAEIAEDMAEQIVLELSGSLAQPSSTIE